MEAERRGARETHFNHLVWFLWVWKLLWVLLRTGLQKGLTQRACQSVASRSLLRFLKVASVITTTFVGCQFSSFLLFHPRSLCWNWLKLSRGCDLARPRSAAASDLGSLSPVASLRCSEVIQQRVCCVLDALSLQKGFSEVLEERSGCPSLLYWKVFTSRRCQAGGTSFLKHDCSENMK